MIGTTHAQDSRTHSSNARHNDYVGRGFLYRLDFYNRLNLLAVAGFGRGVDRLNFFVGGTLRLARLHRGQMRIIRIWKLPLFLHYLGLTLSTLSLILYAH